MATPNTLWASDITYIPTAEGWLYMAVTLDMFSRKVVGWAFSDRLTDDLTLAELTMAMRQRPDSAMLTHHSDSKNVGTGCSWVVLTLTAIDTGMFDRCRRSSRSVLTPTPIDAP